MAETKRMEAHRLGERVGSHRLEETDARTAKAIFREEHPFRRAVETAYFRMRSRPSLWAAIMVAGVAAIFAVGFTFGAWVAAPGATSPLVISPEQAQAFHQQATDLADVEGRLVVAEGQAAFFESQTTALSADLEELKRAVNEARTEMVIIVGIYEECMNRLYPVACVEAARPAADAFLAKLFDGEIITSD